ncbi:MAG: hypothetical protein R3C28_12885 [Pirellulaceae bacterium]
MIECRATIRLLTVFTIMASSFWTDSLRAHLVGEVQPLDLVASLAPLGNETLSVYTDVWANGEIALLGTKANGVLLVDVSLPSAPQSTGVYEPNSAFAFDDIKALDNVGYFSSSNGGGLHVVDLSDSQQPTLLSKLDSTNGAFDSISGSFVRNNMLYAVNESSSQIRVFDITHPATPALVTSIETHDPQGLADVTIRDNRMYVAGLHGVNAMGATYVYDLSLFPSESPTLVAQLSTGFNTSSVSVTDNNQTVVAVHRKPGGGVEAWNLDDSPVEVVAANASDYGINAFSTAEVEIAGGLAYVAWHSAGVQVLDLDNLRTDGSLPVIGNFDTNPGLSPLAGYVGAKGIYPHLGVDRILASDSQFGLFVLDASNVVPIFGDLDLDRQLTANDIDLLAAYLRGGTENLNFDMNRDQSVNWSDHDFMVKDLIGVAFGDANLDGVFNSADLVKVFKPGEYEDDLELNSTWESGDWNGDGEFSTSDLIKAFQEDAYSNASLPQLVPESTGTLPLLCVMIYLSFLQRRKK